MRLCARAGAGVAVDGNTQLEDKLLATSARKTAMDWWAAAEKPTLLGMAWQLNKYEFVAGCVCSAIYGGRSLPAPNQCSVLPSAIL